MGSRPGWDHRIGGSRDTSPVQSRKNETITPPPQQLPQLPRNNRQTPFKTALRQEMPQQPPEGPSNQSPSDRTLHARQLHILSNSSNFSTGAWTVYDIGGDMIFQNSDTEELRRIVNEFQQALPAAVRHSDSNALIITDALGETLTVPWSFVPTYDMLIISVKQELQHLLVNHFRGKIGERRVTEGRYCVGRVAGSDDGIVVQASDWRRIRDEHQQLVMSMLIEQAVVEELRKMCPKCGRTELGTYVDQGWQVRQQEAEAGDNEVWVFRHVRRQEIMIEHSVIKYAGLCSHGVASSNLQDVSPIYAFTTWRHERSRIAFADRVGFCKSCFTSNANNRLLTFGVPKSLAEKEMLKARLRRTHRRSVSWTVQARELTAHRSLNIQKHRRIAQEENSRFEELDG
ncbi:hypothetical protein DFP72DRAFT_851192 [Ephemerocybe angulata]|uniref:Ubiquitin-like domain-containing protein n=1 Tax=Ephemerocybe angulata TaxID=980116 RepID=A0A8H6HQL3_9AGAR|nr:hypothetical protein DFP72DRAFT_851192 [Tulosesus angulatus]